jgi:hypothetical protein
LFYTIPSKATEWPPRCGNVTRAPDGARGASALGRCDDN